MGILGNAVKHIFWKHIHVLINLMLSGALSLLHSTGREAHRGAHDRLVQIYIYMLRIALFAVELGLTYCAGTSTY